MAEGTSALKQYWLRYKRLNPWFVMTCYMLTLVAWGIVFLPPQGDRIELAALLIPTSIILDYLLHRWQTGKPNLQSSIITGSIVTVLMPFDVSRWVALLAVAIAVGSKHFLLWKKKHVFNPATTGVAVTALLFGYALGWWPDSFTAGNGYFFVTAFLGLLNVWRVHRYPAVAGFGVVYFLLVLGGVHGSFPPLNFDSLSAAWPWFFTFFMLPEPVTSPGAPRLQVIYGMIVAVAAFWAGYIPALAPAALLWGLLAANVFAAWHRNRRSAV